MPKNGAAAKFNLTFGVINLWVNKYLEGGEEALLSDNRGRNGKMGRKPKPKLEDFEVDSIEYLKRENELLKKHCS